MNKDDVVRQEAMSLAIGETMYTYCPFCGAKHEQKFCISRNSEGLVFHCLRAKCKAKGFVSSIASSVYTKQRKKPTKVRSYPDVDMLVPLVDIYNKYNIYINNIYNNIYNTNINIYKYIYNTYINNISLKEIYIIYNIYIIIYKYNINIYKYNILYNTDRNTVVFPVVNYLGMIIGYIDRSYLGRSPKALAYPLSDKELLLNFSVKDLSGTCIVVEDMLSCYRLGNLGYNGVSILGTDISHDTVSLLSSMYSKMIICLDNDATVTANKAQRKYNLYFPKGIETRHLPKDIKDMTDEEIKTIVGDI